MEHIAWTGGSPPQSILKISNEEYRYAVKLCNASCKAWRDYWGDEPDAGTFTLFWNRARYDAHATFREGGS